MKKILIVEDEVIIAEDLEMTLKNNGFQVCAIVATGEDAVLKTNELNPDLIIMDIRLDDEMDGIEAAGIIRQNSDVPIVYLTAYSDTAILVRANATNLEAFLTKPFKMKELVDIIKMAIM
jgi:CheY-like chemotaxis protein